MNDGYQTARCVQQCKRVADQLKGLMDQLYMDIQVDNAMKENGLPLE